MVSLLTFSYMKGLPELTLKYFHHSRSVSHCIHINRLSYSQTARQSRTLQGHSQCFRKLQFSSVMHNESCCCYSAASLMCCLSVWCRSDYQRSLKRKKKHKRNEKKQRWKCENLNKMVASVRSYLHTYSSFYVTFHWLSLILSLLRLWRLSYARSCVVSV